MPNDRDRSEIKLVLVGNPDSRRVTSFLEAAHGVGGVQVAVVPYQDLLAGGWEASRPSPGTIVRIESPGENADTTRAILKLGIEPMATRRRVPVDSKAIDGQPLDRGQIVHPLQWYLGFCNFLERLEREWRPAEVRWMSTPRSIATAFDKLACRDRWLAADIPVPGGYPGVTTYAELRRLRLERHARLFVKLRYGYSAMGAVALEWRSDLVRAITTVEVVWSQGRPRMFVNKKPRIMQREFEIAWLLDTLGMEDIVVEDWLPKARWRSKPFDLRIVTIGGKARHVVGRAHDSPFTNLNLDAQRIAEADVRQRLGDAWPDVLSLAEQAAAQLPEATTLGMDILVKPCRRKFAVLEANAFGDYLPDLRQAGVTTYEAQLQSLLQAIAQAAEKAGRGTESRVPARSFSGRNAAERAGSPTVPVAPRDSNSKTPETERDLQASAPAAEKAGRATLSDHPNLGESDLVMITFDALRYDVACAALQAGRTPFLAKLVGTGWERRHSPGSFTYAAHAAFFAGFWPTPAPPGPQRRPFALRFAGSRSIEPKTSVLDGDNIVEGLRQIGYRTVCVGGVGFFNKRNPLGSVFPALFDDSEWRSEFAVSEVHSAREQVRCAAAQVAQTPPDRPLFLFVNFSATHPPTHIYVAGASADSVDTQVAALAYVDRQLPMLFESLQGRGRGGMAYLMSDHGTLFGEDGCTGHRVGHPDVWTVPYAEFAWEARV